MHAYHSLTVLRHVPGMIGYQFYTNTVLGLSGVWRIVEVTIKTFIYGYDSYTSRSPKYKLDILVLPIHQRLGSWKWSH